LKLEIELVPSTVWFSSLHRLMTKKAWDGLRDEIIRERGKKCEVCGETEGTLALHEIWTYDDKKHVQKLDGFFLLCNMCHYVKHIGLAGILANKGRLDYNKVVEHFCKVNNCTREEFEKNKAEAFETWKKRSNYEWKQDFGKYKELITTKKKDMQRNIVKFMR
jgi:hypothetical protein